MNTHPSKSGVSSAAGPISPADLARVLADHPGSVRLLDVRTPGEHSTAHIAGSYNVPVDLLAEHARSQADVSEARALVRSALDALGPRERRIVALRYYRDWSQESIAAEIGLSQVQVSRLLSASLAKMRDRLEAA